MTERRKLVFQLPIVLLLTWCAGSARMGADPPTDPPVLLEPAGCINTLRPTFRWEPVLDATSYRLVVALAEIDVFIIDEVVVETSHVPDFDLAPGQPYRWKVKAFNSDGAGPWSDLAYFTPFCVRLTCGDYGLYSSRRECEDAGWPVCEIRYRDDGTGDLLTCWAGFN